MSEDPTAGEPGTARDGSGPTVQRLDERLGLAVRRATLGPVTLVTYARDHVTVRTPSRPDLRSGNTLDLVEPPGSGDLERWVARYEETVGMLGAPHVQLRWEIPLPPDAPAAVPPPDEELVAAAGRLGLELTPVTTLLLDGLIEPRQAAPAELTAVEAPSAVPGGAVDRRWHAATVLYRYAVGDSPDQWRDWDADLVGWSVEQQRGLATAGRCRVWVAMRHAAPVARLTVSHDRQGLAAVEDVVTHPIHRGLGIASGLTTAAVREHLAAQPGSRVGLGAEPGSRADRLSRALGFRPHATVWTALRPEARPLA